MAAFDITVIWDDDDADLGAVARALTDLLVEQDGVTRVKTYINAFPEPQLVAEAFSEDLLEPEWTCDSCGKTPEEVEVDPDGRYGLCVPCEAEHEKKGLL